MLMGAKRNSQQTKEDSPLTKDLKIRDTKNNLNCETR